MTMIGKTASAALAAFTVLFSPPVWSQGDRAPVGAPVGQTEPPPSNIWIRPGPEMPESGRPLTNPYEGQPEAIQEGKRLYSWFNCIGCHASEGGGGMGPPLSDTQWIYGSDPASIFQSIWQGRPEGMPTWAGRIPEDQIWKIVAYLETLQQDKSGQQAQSQD